MTNYKNHGNLPYKAIVVHGGPGAPGCCAKLCRELSGEFGILEHLQKGHSIQKLIEELYEIILRFNLEKTVLIGVTIF